MLISARLKGDNLYGIVKDITDRKKKEFELIRKRNQLREQNKEMSNFSNILEITSSSMDFHVTLNKLLSFINQIFNSDCIIGYDYNKDAGLFVPAHQHNLTEEGIAYFLSSNLSASESESITENKKICFIEDVDKTRLLMRNSSLSRLLQHLNIKSMVTLPKIFKGEVGAIIISLFSSKKKFGMKERDTISRLHNHIQASYISSQNTKLLLNNSFEQSQQLEIMKAMTKIDEVILTSSNKAEIIYGAISLFSGAIKNDIVEIMEISNNSLKLIARCVENRTQAIKELFKTTEIGSYPNIAFKIPTYIPDLSHENILGNYENRFLIKGYKTLLLIPLLSRGDLKGLIAIGSKRASSFLPQHCYIAQRLANQLSIALTDMELVKETEDMLFGIVDSLVTALDAKSPWTHGHSRRVGEVAVEIGKALMLDQKQISELQLAGLFHDIGKIGTYDVILNKPGKLSADEVKLVKNHPGKTHEILSPIKKMKNVSEAAMHHHEKWDGSGYPDGLAGDNIPYLSRILTLADAYDAMSSARPYRKALSKDQIVTEITNEAGTQFDPDIAEVFINILERKRGLKAA